MSSVASEIAVIIALVLLNGALSMSETALVSSRPARLRDMAQRGVRGARVALRMLEDPTRFLATVQIGITLVGVVSGAFAGVTIGEELADALRPIPALANYADALGVGIVVVAITYLSLIIGELVPKRLALSLRERIAVTAAPPMWLLQRIATPAVWTLTVSTAAVVRLLGQHGTKQPGVTQQELVEMVREGADEGTIETAERDLIEGVLDLDVRSLGAVMTPRHRIAWLDLAWPAHELLRTVVDTGYTRFPVCEGSPDVVRGTVTAHVLLSAALPGGEPDVRALIRPPLYLPESASALDALEALAEAEVRLALVVDEYGAVQGLCTLNDILAPLISEALARGATRPSINLRADGTQVVDGMLPMHQFVEGVLGEEAAEREFTFNTVAGLVIAQLQTIPTVGDTFVWRGLQIEVLDMDGHRVDKVLVTRLAHEAGED